MQLSEDELAAFLGRGGTGTLSFATPPGEPPFSLPVSYGYDADSGNFYFRLAFPPESDKEDVLDNAVSFVTHGETDEGWRSVVAHGHLEEVSELNHESSAVQGMWAVDIPQVDIFEDPPEDVPFRHFRLRPDDLSGRKEVQSDD